MELNTLDLNTLLQQIKNKINHFEIIDESLIDKIYFETKNIQMEHNKKINQWYDEKYHNDLIKFQQNNYDFCKLNEFLKKNSFIFIKEKQTEYDIEIQTEKQIETEIELNKQ